MTEACPIVKPGISESEHFGTRFVNREFIYSYVSSSATVEPHLRKHVPSGLRMTSLASSYFMDA